MRRLCPIYAETNRSQAVAKINRIERDMDYEKWRFETWLAGAGSYQEIDERVGLGELVPTGGRDLKDGLSTRNANML